jgi:hypothetical protein
LIGLRIRQSYNRYAGHIRNLSASKGEFIFEINANER